MVSLGLGLGITHIRPPARPNDPDTKDIETALAERRLINAKHESSDLVLAPYALYRGEDDRDVLLLAVVLRTSGVPLNAWEPRPFEVRKLAQVSVRADTFFPSHAFDKSVYGDRLIEAVHLSQD
ncbi:hypothetical protein [Rubellimicrobium roseum]|uniref:Uncharacterized protein n=1 Tax=Rubellimicrobium roseum TaxID=687525 RepID=A0A5C4NH38_9RHOB|nr:hypothetical protein [Rubellimicrobium roseum]TNC74144.1 hypothetical protein FHG71_02825 [Rubellimicrobium roseum]